MSSWSLWSFFLFFVNTVSISSLHFVIISAAAIQYTPSPSLYNRPRPLHPSSASTPVLSLYIQSQPAHLSSASAQYSYMSPRSFWSSFLFCKYCIYFFIKLCDYFSRSRTPSPSLFNRPRPLHPSSASTPILSLYSLYNYPRPLHPASVSTSGLILYFHQQPLHPASASTSLQSVSEKPHTPAIIYAYFRSYLL